MTLQTAAFKTEKRVYMNLNCLKINRLIAKINYHAAYLPDALRVSNRNKSYIINFQRYFSSVSHRVDSAYGVLKDQRMDLRKTARYSLFNNEQKQPDMTGVSCTFDFDPKLKGVLVDMGLGGFGYEIHDLTGSQAEQIEKLDTFIMNIYFGTEVIIASVTNVWNKVIFDQGKMFLEGGVAINIISPEERLKLSAMIEKIRSSK
jgi:hypothetical protein